MPKSKRIAYEVEGSGEFPLDMLRYDCSFPATEKDAHQAQWHGANTLRDGYYDAPKRRVILFSDSESAPNSRRWESFGWRVIATAKGDAASSMPFERDRREEAAKASNPS